MAAAAVFLLASGFLSTTGGVPIRLSCLGTLLDWTVKSSHWGQEIEFAVFAYERAPVAQLTRLYSEASAESRSITSLSRWPSHWDWGWKAAHTNHPRGQVRGEPSCDLSQAGAAMRNGERRENA